MSRPLAQVRVEQRGRDTIRFVTNSVAKNLEFARFHFTGPSDHLFLAMAEFCHGNDPTGELLLIDFHRSP